MPSPWACHPVCPLVSPQAPIHAAHVSHPRFPLHYHSLPHPTASIAAATAQVRLALFALLDRVRQRVDDQHHPDGYNTGINDGQAAGQTVPHLHIHLIPRYAGDVPDPTGGVRFVIPDRANYLGGQSG